MNISRKFVRYDFYSLNQSRLESELENFGRFRDIYKDDRRPSAGTVFIFANLVKAIASGVNGSLITRGHPEFLNWNAHPTIIPGLNLFDCCNRTMKHVWNAYYNRASNESVIDKPHFVKIPETHFNLMYCGVPQRKLESVWNFLIFTHSFDFPSWVCLILSLIMVTRLSNSRYPFFSNLAVLITPAAVSTSRRPSKLFVLWMMACLVVVTYYTGEMTSEVISPTPEETMTSITDLKDNEYSVICSDRITQGIVNGTVQALSAASFVSKETFILADLMRESGKDQDYDIFYEKMISQDKIAHVNMWPFILRYTSLANDLLEPMGKFPRDKKCYIGKRMVKAGEMFYGFLPPGGLELARIFQYLLGAGIVSRWESEFHGLASAIRVQDRVRILGPTRLLEETESFVVLTLSGKILTIFLLWMVFIFLCTACLLLEVLIEL